MNTLNKSGNYARAVELFFAFFNDREEIESMKKQRKNSDVIPRNNQTTDLNVSDDADKVVNISNNEDTQSADLHQKSNLKQRSSTVLEWNETVLLAALTSCANGRLGQDGLDILYLASFHTSQFWKNCNEKSYLCLSLNSWRDASNPE